VGGVSDELNLARLQALRGWTAEAITRLGIRVEGDRVVIPVRDATGDVVGRLRYQPDHAKLNGLPKMLADEGTTRELFPPVAAIADDEPVDGVVWLVEGEPDAVRMWSVGLVAVGVPGAQNWRDEWSAPFARPGWTVVCCFDCDPTGRTHVQRVAASLYEHGVDVRVLDLDAARDDGYDLSDFLAAATTRERGCARRGRWPRRRRACAVEALLDGEQPLPARGRQAARERPHRRRSRSGDELQAQHEDLQPGDELQPRPRPRSRRNRLREALNRCCGYVSQLWR
jgi:Toprim-like